MKLQERRAMNIFFFQQSARDLFPPPPANLVNLSGRKNIVSVPLTAVPSGGTVKVLGTVGVKTGKKLWIL